GGGAQRHEGGGGAVVQPDGQRRVPVRRNKPLHSDRGRILVSGDTTPLQRPRRVNWSVSRQEVSMTEERMRLQWVSTAGGPHLVLPERDASAWEGWLAPSGGRVVAATFRCNPEGPATHYAPACRVSP